MCHKIDVFDLNTELQLMSHRALELTHGTGVAIALADKASMICRASLGNDAPPLGCCLDTSSGISGECVRTGNALRCDDSEVDPRVDLASCRRLQIRSILAVPILLERKVVGLLEVFARRPYAFDDDDLAALKQLAQTMLPTPPGSQSTPAPKLHVEPDALHKVAAPINLASPAVRFWDDVFVSSQLRWQPFVQSLMLHGLVVVAALGFLKFRPIQPHTISPVFDSSDVIYYLPSEYRPRLQNRTPASMPKNHPTELTKQRAISVPRERDSRTSARITSPDIKLKQDLRPLGMLSWNSVAPTAPLSAITRMQLITPAALVGMIAPPPDSSTLPRARVQSAPPQAVVEPPPSVHGFMRKNGNFNIGRLEVVTPAPQLPMHEGDSNSPRVQASLSGAAAAVVPPPPSADHLQNGSGRHISSLPAGAMPAVPPPPLVQSTAFSTRTSQATPAMSAVPPSPSIHALANSGRRELSSASVGGVEVVAPPAAIEKAGSRIIRDSPTDRGMRSSEVQSPTEDIDDDIGQIADATEVSLNFIGAVLPLPSSSYFANSEIFLAEEHVNRHRSRLIKLVYDFLPYQPRLSDYGPNYPVVYKLHVTRDPSCDEALMHMTSSVTTSGSTPINRLQLDPKYSNQQQRTLACFRTTADDYRRATRRRQHK